MLSWLNKHGNGLLERVKLKSSLPAELPLLLNLFHLLLTIVSIDTRTLEKHSNVTINLFIRVKI